MQAILDSSSVDGRALTPSVVARAAADLADTTIARQIDDVQREMDTLKHELIALRRRDETLNFCMRRLDEELRLAARLQQDFLPRSLPALGPVRFHTLFRPAGYVSGDLYDIMRLDERRVGFYVADAVGHGMPAALLTMFIKQALRTKDIFPGGYRLLKPSEALERLNEAMLEQNLSHATFATALYGVIDCDSLEVTLARAGHPHPLILRADGSLEPIESDGGLLGIFPGEQYADATAKLHPGDRLLLYSDGVEVAFNDHATDAGRWKHELVSRHDLPADRIVSEFAGRIDIETAGQELRDDLTLVLLDVLSNQVSG